MTAVADDLLAAMMQRNPELATFWGLPGARHDGITDNSLAAVQAYERREDELLGRLRAVDRGRIATRSARVLYDTEAEMLGSSVQSRVCRSELWPASQMFGWQTMYPMLAQMQPVGTADLRAQALARWRQLPRYVDTEIANLREGLREGYSTPAVTVERVIGQLDGLVALAPEKSPFYSPALRDSTPEFRAELARVVANDITPAARRYRDFLKNEYLPKARTTVALSDLPNGEQCYRALVRASTTLDVEPRAVHELGLKEMDRIEGELRVISKRSFGGIDNRTLLARLRDDPKYTFKSREEMLAYARDAVARAKAAAPKWFGILPKADVVVEPYPEFQEKSAPGGEYMQPAEDGSRPGIYRINTYQPEKQAKAPVQSTAFHEAIPGHHLQLAIAQELPNTHRLQRLSSNSGFTEGWALYAERLSDEMGLFSSDLDRVGLLSNEALRAARLVVDPGLHVLGWTRQQAIDYMLAHTAESPEAVATEVDRYIVMPGQATSYMLGRNEIMSLRDEARRELGSRFEIREFHDRVLEDGSVTLPALRVKIEQWIAAKKQAAATR